MYKVVMFDLDGTVVNSQEGIANSVKYSLNYYGITENDRAILRAFIGPPLYESFKKYYGFDDDKAYEAVDKYREYYSVKGIYECSLLQGVEKLLKGLKQNGYTVALATSKPIVFAERVLKHLGVDKYFDYTFGAQLRGHDEKSEIISDVLEATGAQSYQCVMVGDRKHDVIGAHQCGMKAIAITMGFGDRAEFLQAKADYICDSFDEVYQIIKREENE